MSVYAHGQILRPEADGLNEYFRTSSQPMIFRMCFSSSKSKILLLSLKYLLYTDKVVLYSSIY